MAISAGIPLTLAILRMEPGWHGFWGFFPILLGFILVGAVVAGILTAIPIIIRGWAWRKIAKDTPVIDEENDSAS